MAQIYVKSSSGLTPLGGNVTKESIKQALGYEPANGVNLKDDGSGRLLVVDSNNNTILRIDKEGVHSVDFEANGSKLSQLGAHTSNSDIHITPEEKEKLSSLSDTNDKFSGSYEDIDGAPNITTDEADDELLICDSQGNIIMKVNASGLHTTSVYVKDSIVNQNEALLNKKVSILGDSISTFEGYLPDGYATYYPKGDVTSVDKTWWKKVIEATGMELATNASYSGSTVQTDGKEIAGADDRRITAVGSNGTPDIIFVKMGINDANYEDLSALGEVDKTFTTPFTDASAAAFDTTTFLGAYQAMLTKLMIAYPNAKIICVGLNWSKSVAADDVAVASEKIAELCELYGCEYINIHKCGITPANMDTYLIDGVHPTAAGHTLMAKYITKQLQNMM